MKKFDIILALSLTIFSCSNLYSYNETIAERGGGGDRDYGGNRSSGYSRQGDTQMERTNKNDAAVHEYQNANNNRAENNNNNNNNGYNNGSPEVIVAPGYQAPNSSPGGYGN